MDIFASHSNSSETTEYSYAYHILDYAITAL